MRVKIKTETMRVTIWINKCHIFDDNIIGESHEILLEVKRQRNR